MSVDYVARSRTVAVNPAESRKVVAAKNLGARAKRFGIAEHQQALDRRLEHIATPQCQVVSLVGDRHEVQAVLAGDADKAGALFKVAQRVIDSVPFRAGEVPALFPTLAADLDAIARDDAARAANAQPGGAASGPAVATPGAAGATNEALKDD